MVHSSMGGMHVGAALAAILLGLGVIVSPKGHALHRLLGLAYAFCMLASCCSALLLYRMTGHFGLFHFFAVICLVYVVLGLSEAILRRPNWLRRHVTWMGWSYLGLLAAAATEALIRLPMLPRLGNTETFIFGGVIAVVFTAVGMALMPRWQRLALRWSE
jgi:uncharacterized membrane protein